MQLSSIRSTPPLPSLSPYTTPIAYQASVTPMEARSLHQKLGQSCLIQAMDDYLFEKREQLQNLTSEELASVFMTSFQLQGALNSYEPAAIAVALSQLQFQEVLDDERGGYFKVSPKEFPIMPGCDPAQLQQRLARALHLEMNIVHYFCPTTDSFTDITPAIHAAVSIPRMGVDSQIRTNLTRICFPEQPLTDLSFTSSSPLRNGSIHHGKVNLLLHGLMQEKIESLIILVDNKRLQYLPGAPESTCCDQVDFPSHCLLPSVTVTPSQEYNSTLKGLLSRNYTCTVEDSSNDYPLNVHFFTEWIDFGDVTVEVLDALVDACSAKTLIHCRGGVGRAGTLTVAREIKRRLQNREEVDLEVLVQAIRSCRPFSIQASQGRVPEPEQLQLLMEYIRYCEWNCAE